MSKKTASGEIDAIIKSYSGWKGEILSDIRDAIRHADPEIVEEVKWKMANRPEGLPAWYHNGLVCFAETWKDNIKLIFSKGAQLKDSSKVFNARLKSKNVRAIELKAGGTVNYDAIEVLITEAVKINMTNKVK